MHAAEHQRRSEAVFGAVQTTAHPQNARGLICGVDSILDRKLLFYINDLFLEGDSNRRSLSRNESVFSGGTGSAAEAKRAVSRASSILRGDRQIESPFLRRRVCLSGAF
jgi:hypothetical protein